MIKYEIYLPLSSLPVLHVLEYKELLSLLDFLLLLMNAMEIHWVNVDRCENKSETSLV